MPTFAVKPEFREDIERLVIPQFFAAIPDTLFTCLLYTSDAADE